MSISVVQINQTQAEHIIGLEEGHFLDVKSADIAPAKLTRTMSAFANADGGELHVGVDESRESRAWRGFENPEAANGHIQAFEEMFPLSGEFQYEFLSSERYDGLILHITILKSASIKTASDGRIYVRRGAQNLPVTHPEAIERLRRTKGIISYESETVSNADLEELTNSEAIIGFMLEVIPESEPELWLRKQRLIVDSKASVAGLLLFADEPQVHLPKGAIKIYRYSTTDAEGGRENLDGDPIAIEGNVYDQIRGAVSMTRELIEGIQVLSHTGLESVTYPPETLHEIITNAVLHRDYSLADDVHVRIFDNRVEVESPGRLPAHITPKNILKERFARNPMLVRIINKFPEPPNKDVGEGLNTAFAAMKKLQLKAPEIAEGDHSVRVTIRHERLASPEKIIMEHVREHGTIVNRTAREITNIDSEYQVRKILKKLLAAGELEQVDGTRTSGTSYRLAESPA